MYVIEKIYGNYQALYMTEADIEITLFLALFHTCSNHNFN